MASVKIKVDPKQLQELRKSLRKAVNVRQSVSKSTVERAGTKTVKLMKDFISDGISPIRRKGKFPRYAKSYEDQILGRVAFFTIGSGSDRIIVPISNPTRRSRKFRNKDVRPVNLKLSGKFLKNLKSITKADRSFEVGFFTSREIELEEFHRNAKNSRPIIPEGSERLNKTIEDAITTLYLRDLERAIKKI